MKTVFDCYRYSNMAIAKKDFDYCIELCREGLELDPNHVPLLVNLSRAFIEKRFYVPALETARRASELRPDASAPLVNMARACLELGFSNPALYDEAEKHAHAAADIDPTDVTACLNASFLYLSTGQHEKNIEWCRRGLALDRSNTSLMFNMSLSFLTNFMWEEGWCLYDQSMDGRFPNGEPQYNRPLWNGESSEVICYGEQGLGDTILFASMLPDMKKDATVVLDVDERLKGLFERSFGCETHGTRYDDNAVWKRDASATHRIPIGSLGAFYRSRNEDFPQQAYLKADPERRLQWRALLDSLGDKPKIGIAWTGGVPHTYQRARSLSLRDMYPLLEYDAEWVCLQYKETDDVPDFMHHWPRATQTNDYDDTAALIAELDLVISVTTTAVHCAGALGVKTWCLVPKSPQWRYGAEGEGMLWYPSVELFRQNEAGTWPMQALIEKLSAMGIEKSRNLSMTTPVTVLPRNSMQASSRTSLQKPGLEKYLITGLGKVA